MLRWAQHWNPNFAAAHSARFQELGVSGETLAGVDLADIDSLLVDGKWRAVFLTGLRKLLESYALPTHQLVAAPAFTASDERVQRLHTIVENVKLTQEQQRLDLQQLRSPNARTYWRAPRRATPRHTAPHHAVYCVVLTQRMPCLLTLRLFGVRSDGQFRRTDGQRILEDIESALRR